MPETTLISTLYRTEPFMPAALRFAPSKIILLVNQEPDKTVSESIAFIKKAFSSAAHVKEVTIKHYDLYDIAKKTVDIIEAEHADGKRIVVNVTGGRKTASMGVNFACYARKDMVDRIVYVVEETNEFIELPKLTFDISKSKREILEACAKDCQNIPALAEKLEKTKGMVYTHLRELKDLGYVDENYKLTTAGKVALL